MFSANRIIALLAAVAVSSAARAQTAPSRPATAAAQTAPRFLPGNLERMLDAPVSIDAEQKTLGDLVASLQKTTNTNIVANWNALALSGVTRDTVVTVHFKDVAYEQAIKALMEMIPVKPPGVDAPLAPAQLSAGQGLRPNYQVGDNALQLTTNANIGRAVVAKLYPVSRLLSMTLPGEPPGDNARALEAIFHAALAQADEPIDAKGRALAIKTETLGASVSDRGHATIARVQTLIATPVKPGQLATGLIVTGTAKRAQDALAKAFPPYKDGALSAAVALAIAREPQKAAATLNVALLPGTAEELAKEKPDLSGTITDGGIILIGPSAVLQARTAFSAYDLRDVIRKQQAKARPAPAAADVQASLVQTLVAKVLPPGGGWSDAAKPGAVSMMIPYHGTLVVIAPADTHRQLTQALQELNR